MTSNNGSSSATVSPMLLNHCVMVPSVTVSPSCGSGTSAMSLNPCLSCRLVVWCDESQPLKLRPVIESAVSPKSSERLGCGWMNSATSSTVASQFTARYPPLSCSVTQGPTMCTPNIWPAEPSAFFLAMIFTRPSSSPMIIARLLNLK